MADIRRHDSDEWSQASVMVTSSTPAKQEGHPRKKPRPPHFYRLVERHSTTILDSPEWSNSVFIGFYVLFWVVVATMAAREIFIDYVRTGYIIPTHRIFHILRRDLVKVAITDLVMYLGMYVTYGLVLLSKNSVLDWWTTGWKIHHLWQTIYTLFFIWLARSHQFPWIGQIFITLHCLVQVMKQHSYQVYNGYMQHIVDRLKKTDPGPEHDRLKLELNSLGHDVYYPKNVTLSNFFWFTMFPVIIYETEYPRIERIRWNFLLGKLLAVFGCLALLVLISERFLYPVAIRAMSLRDKSLSYRLHVYPMILLDLFPPFVAAYMLVFYLIWDAILNSLAELTRFDDRQFYRDWWNSSTWDKFARDWNVPVHNFLRRHVYHSSIFFLNLSKTQAVLFTFILSALIHELAMFVIFGRLRGYLLLMQLSQLPLEYISTMLFARRKVLGITAFWIGMAVGPSLLCSLYLTF